MKVYIVFKNDYPICGYRTEERAHEETEKLKAEQDKSNGGICYWYQEVEIKD